MFLKLKREREKDRPSSDTDLTFPGKWPQLTLHETTTKQHRRRGTESELVECSKVRIIHCNRRFIAQERNIN